MLIFITDKLSEENLSCDNTGVFWIYGEAFNERSIYSWGLMEQSWYLFVGML